MDVVDGSTVDLWSGCPYQAHAIESGRHVAMPTVVSVGNEVHDALSKCTLRYVETNGGITTSEMRRELSEFLESSRPDVQPEVIDAFKASAWQWCRFITSIVPADRIIGFDGGEPLFKSGQLSTAFEGTILTSELDLLYDSLSSEVLCEVDYKSGWTRHDAVSVLRSGQFQRHAILVFDNFPNCTALEVQIWDTRINRRTYKVTFVREKVQEYRARVSSALKIRAMYRGGTDVPTWPSIEKCSRCPVVTQCPAADAAIRSCSDDPRGFVKDMMVVRKKLEAMERIASEYVDQYGTIDAGDVKFGRDWPKEPRRVYPKLYGTEDFDG